MQGFEDASQAPDRYVYPRNSLMNLDLAEVHGMRHRGNILLKKGKHRNWILKTGMGQWFHNHKVRWNQFRNGLWTSLQMSWLKRMDGMEGRLLNWQRAINNKER